MMFLIVFTGWVVYQTVRIFLDYPKLVEMRLVFNKGLEINDVRNRELSPTLPKILTTSTQSLICQISRGAKWSINSLN